MSETQSVTIKPRFELVLGAALLIVVLTVALRTAHSEQPEPAPTDRKEEQAVSRETRDQRVLAVYKDSQDDANLEELHTPEGVTCQRRPVKDLQALEEYKSCLAATASGDIPTTAAAFQEETATAPDSSILNTATPRPIDRKPADKPSTLKMVRIYLLSGNRRTDLPESTSQKAGLVLTEVEVRTRAEHLDLLCADTTDNQPESTAISDATTDSQVQYGQSFVVDGNLWVEEESPPYLVMSLGVASTGPDDPPAVNTVRVRLSNGDVMTNSQPALKLVHTFLLDEVPSSGSLKVAGSKEAPPVDLDDRETEDQLLQSRNREPSLELLQTFYFEDQTEVTTLSGIPASCQLQPEQRLTFSGTVKVWRENHVYVVLSLMISLSDDVAAQNSVGESSGFTGQVVNPLLQRLGSEG